MTLLNAFEDFLLTLQAIPGEFSKLRYLASIRNVARRYQHWGMSRIHGEQQAQAAMARAHQRVFLNLLRAPTKQVVDNAMRGSDYAFVLTQKPQWESLLPNDLGGGSRRHFIAVMKALSGVLRQRGVSKH